MKVLINAYACSPGMGSEPGMAWNWCVNLANYCELHIVTEGEFRDKIEAALPLLPQGQNMHFYYNPVSDRIRKMCWNQGDWRFYIYYRVWQKKTLHIANKIIKNNRIDVIHQLNMIGFREPGYLWTLDYPFVWGPADAKEQFPVAYLKGATFRQKIFFNLKNLANLIQLYASKRIKRAIKRTDILISASEQSVRTFKKYYNRETIKINETGSYVNPILNNTKRFHAEKLEILWVGKLDFRKQLAIALKTLSKCKNRQQITLHIVGGTSETEPVYKKLATRLTIENNCIWHGKVTHSEVQQMMQSSHLLFFTSIAEGTPHVVLEAIGNNLPIVCFDTCGHGDVVNDSIGVKVEVSKPVESEKAFATILDNLYENRKTLSVFSENCKERQLELSWENKANQMYALYNEAIEKHRLSR